MRHQTTITAQATWGTLAGALLIAVGLVMSGLVSAGVFPLVVIEALDPFCLGHSISALLLCGAVAGGIAGGLSFRWRARKDA